MREASEGQEGPLFEWTRAPGPEERRARRGSLSPTFNFRQSRGALATSTRLTSGTRRPWQEMFAIRIGSEPVLAPQTAPARFSRITAAPRDFILIGPPGLNENPCAIPSVRQDTVRSYALRRKADPVRLNAHWHTRHFRLSRGDETGGPISSSVEIIYQIFVDLKKLI